MPECGLCKDCRAWFAIPEVETEWGYCAWAEVEAGGLPSYEETKAYAWNNSDDWGQLITRENFGCVQFASKEES